MQPRERYLVEGPEGLGDVDLVALVLGTGAGGRTARAIAADLVDRHGGLGALAGVEPHALAAARGMGPARAIRLHAALALGRRAVLGERTRAEPIQGPEGAAAWFLPALDGLPHEEVHVLLLDRRMRPVAYRRVSAGSDRATVLEPRSVLRRALEVGAAAMILAHNHPSGTEVASAQDLEVTRRLRDAGRVVDVPLLDHLVIGGGRWSSLARESGWEAPWRASVLACGGRDAP